MRALAASPLSNVQVHLVENMDEVGQFLRWLGERRPVLGLDIETSGLSIAHDRIRLVQFGDARHGWALPYDEWKGVIRHAITAYEGKFALQHAKFDAGFLIRDGIPFPWHRAHDTMLMSFLYDSLGPRGLKPAAALYVTPEARRGEQELKAIMHKRRWGYGDVPIQLPEYWGYGAMDTVLTALLAEKLWPKVQTYRQAYDLELACERVLCDMEGRGVAVDLDYCNAQLPLLRSQLADVMTRLPADFNPNSPPQIVAYLTEAGVSLTEKTKSGLMSTKDEVLASIDHPVAAQVLEARTLTKLIGAYFENFLEFQKDGRVHPHIKQVAAKTGRMSITEPALQQIPRKKLVRDAFIPDDESEVMVLIDYDNEELRVAASISGDETMIKAFEEGRDLHMETAVQLYGAEHAAERRSNAKNTTFSWLFGAGDERIAKTGGVPVYQASTLKRGLAARYPGVARSMQDVIRVVRQRAVNGYGYVVLGNGSHIRIPTEKAYKGWNGRIQGECAVILKQSIVDLDAAGYGEFIRLPVHDELVFSVPRDIVDDVLPGIKEVMTRTEYRVPLTVSEKQVERWGDAYE